MKRRNLKKMMVLCSLASLMAAGPARAQVSMTTWGQGGFRLGDAQATTCNGAAEGTIRYNDTTNVLQFCNGTSWGSIGSGGGGALSGITAATANNTISSGGYEQYWTWSLAGANTVGMTFEESSASTGGAGTQALTHAHTLSGSTAVPLWVTNEGNAASFIVEDTTVTTDTTPFLIDASGNVGVGTKTPSTKMMVVGTLMVGNGGETCNSSTYAGAIRYNGGNLQYCDSSSWKTVGNSTSSAGTPAGSDKQVQFNDGGSTMAGNANLTFDKSTNVLATATLSAATKVSLGLTAGAAAPTVGTPITNITVKTYCASGCTGTTGATYSPAANVVYVTVECVGGGGGAGASGTTTGGAGGGGGAGGYARATMTRATANGVTITVGAAGNGGAAGANAGTNGGNSSFGAILTCNAGLGGTSGGAASTAKVGGAGGSASGGDVNIAGATGGTSVSTGASGTCVGGSGASSPLGIGGPGQNGAGGNGTGYGSGGGGGARNGGNTTGGDGRPGIVIITEYNY